MRLHHFPYGQATDLAIRIVLDCDESTTWAAPLIHDSTTVPLQDVTITMQGVLNSHTSTF